MGFSSQSGYRPLGVYYFDDPFVRITYTMSLEECQNGLWVSAFHASPADFIDCESFRDDDSISLTEPGFAGYLQYPRNMVVSRKKFSQDYLWVFPNGPETELRLVLQGNPLRTSNLFKICCDLLTVAFLGEDPQNDEVERKFALQTTKFQVHPG